MSHDDVPIGEFLDSIASERATPAGGTATAVVGATGAALCEMACLHTVAADADGTATAASTGESRRGTTQNPDPDDGRERSLTEVAEGLRRRREGLLALADQDAAVVEELFGAGAVDPPARLRRRAASVPLAVAEGAHSVLTDAETVVRRSRSGVDADAITGAYLADAAVRASVETARINAGALEDRSFAAEIEGRATAVAESARGVRRRLFGAGTVEP